MASSRARTMRGQMRSHVSLPGEIPEARDRAAGQRGEEKVLCLCVLELERLAVGREPFVVEGHPVVEVFGPNRHRPMRNLRSRSCGCVR